MCRRREEVGAGLGRGVVVSVTLLGGTTGGETPPPKARALDDELSPPAPRHEVIVSRTKE